MMNMCVFFLYLVQRPEAAHTLWCSTRSGSSTSDVSTSPFTLNVDLSFFYPPSLKHLNQYSFLLLVHFYPRSLSDLLSNLSRCECSSFLQRGEEITAEKRSAQLERGRKNRGPKEISIAGFAALIQLGEYRKQKLPHGCCFCLIRSLNTFSDFCLQLSPPTRNFRNRQIKRLLLNSWSTKLCF